MNSEPVILDIRICINCSSEWGSPEGQYPNNDNSADLFSQTIPDEKTGTVLKEIYKLSLLEEFNGPEEALKCNLPLCPPCSTNLTHLYYYYEKFNVARNSNQISYLHEKILKLDQILQDCVEEAQKKLRESVFNEIPDNEEAEISEAKPNFHKNGNDFPDFSNTLEVKMETEDCPENSVEVHSENFMTSIETSEDEISNSPEVSSTKRQKIFDDDAKKIDFEKFNTNQVKTCTDATVLVKRLTRAEIRKATEGKLEEYSPSNVASIRRSSRKSIRVIEKSFPICSPSLSKSSAKTTQRLSKNSGQKQRNTCAKNNSTGESSKNPTQKTFNKSDQNSSQKPAIKPRPKGKNKRRYNPDYKRPRIYEFLHLRKQKHPYPCRYCLEDFDLEVGRTEHLKATHVTPKKSIICLPCGRLFPSNSARVKHEPTCGQPPPHVHLPPYICEQCNKEFSSYTKLQNHRKVTHAQERPFACDQCNARTKTSSLLRYHKQLVHDSGGPSPCPECGKILKNKALLRAHLLRMHTARGLEGYQKTQEKQYAKHRERRREKSKNLTSVCTECDVDFQTITRYRRHYYAVHEKEKKWQCEHCGKSFASATVFINHQKFVHTDERPFVCDQCGKSYKSNKHLQTHFSHVHTEDGRRRYNEWSRQNYKRKARLREELKKLQQGEISARDDEPNVESHTDGADANLFGEIPS